MPIAHIRKPHQLPIHKSDGERNWGFISAAIESESNGEISSAPIRMFQGMHIAKNRGFGKVHIEAEHSKEFQACGFESFILESLSNFEAIYVQGDKRVLLFKNRKAKFLAVLEYREDNNEKHYSIVTVFRTSPGKVVNGYLAWQKR